VSQLEAPKRTEYSENTKAALARKKAAGVRLGAPTKSDDIIVQVRRLKASEASDQAIARALKMSPNTVAKYLLAECK
jgi:DNA invertase Pin-like site-specific DNA recombinase